LVGKPEGKRPLGRQRCRWVENFRMDLAGIGFGGVDRIGLPQDRYRWERCEGGNEHSCSIKCWETTEWLHNWWPLEWYSVPQIQSGKFLVSKLTEQIIRDSPR
jgi:hypothetical protein